MSTLTFQVDKVGRLCTLCFLSRCSENRERDRETSPVSGLQWDIIINQREEAEQWESLSMTGSYYRVTTVFLPSSWRRSSRLHSAGPIRSRRLDTDTLPSPTGSVISNSPSFWCLVSIIKVTGNLLSVLLQFTALSVALRWGTTAAASYKVQTLFLFVKWIKVCAVELCGKMRKKRTDQRLSCSLRSFKSRVKFKSLLFILHTIFFFVLSCFLFRLVSEREIWQRTRDVAL